MYSQRATTGAILPLNTGAKAIGIFRHDEKAVGTGHSGEIARSLPGNESDFRGGAGEGACGGEKAGEAGFCFDVFGETREGEARAVGAATGEGGDNWRGEEQKCDGGGDRIAGKAKDAAAALRAVLFLDFSCDDARHLAKDQRFAWLDSDPGEVEACAGTNECWFNEIEFAGGDAAGDEEKIGDSGAGERSTKGFGGVAGDG